MFYCCLSMRHWEVTFRLVPHYCLLCIYQNGLLYSLHWHAIRKLYTEQGHGHTPGSFPPFRRTYWSFSNIARALSASVTVITESKELMCCTAGYTRGLLSRFFFFCREQQGRRHILSWTLICSLDFLEAFQMPSIKFFFSWQILCQAIWVALGLIYFGCPVSAAGQVLSSTPILPIW